MKNYQTPNSNHSRKSSVKVHRQPLGIINNQDLSLIPTQCATYLQQKVQGLEMRVKNLNSQHVENRSNTQNRQEPQLSPCIPTKSKKIFSSNNKQNIDAQSYYETIINKRLENIIKEPSKNHMYTDNSTNPNDQSKNNYTNKSSLHPSTHQQDLSFYQYHQNKLHSNALQRIVHLTKKLRKFKMIKDQNQDECAPSLAKIKCFCQEYYQECFDFYRCTDLIALKYFIYLLLQDLNTVYSQEAAKTADNEQYYKAQIEVLKEQLDNNKTDQCTQNNQYKVQRMIVDTQNILQDLISMLQQKQNQQHLVSHIETLNSQMKKLKENLSTEQKDIKENNRQEVREIRGASNYKTNNSFLLDERNNTIHSSKSKSPYQKQTLQKNQNFDSEIEQAGNLKRLLDEQSQVNRQLMEKVFKLQNEVNRPNIELQKQISQLQQQCSMKEEKIDVLQQQKLEIQKEANQQQEVFQQLNIRIHEISRNLDQVVQQNNELIKENDQLKDELQILKEKNEQFKDRIDQLRNLEQKYYEIIQDQSGYFQNISELQQENQNLIKVQHQLEAENQGYQIQLSKFQDKFEQEINNFQQIKDEEQEENIKQMRNQLLEQTKIIQLITDEALYLGQVVQYAADILSRHPSDGITTTLVMLQKDLKLKSPVISQKMNILQQFATNLKGLSKQSSAQQINQNDIDLLENLQSESSFSDLMIQNQSASTNINLKGHKQIIFEQDLNSTMSPHNQKEKIQNNELIQMLIVQAHTLEKIIDM